MTNCPPVSELVATFLGDETQPNIVGFVEQLFPLASEWNRLRMSLGGPDHLKVQLGECEPVAVPLPRAKGKLRSMCARVAVICAEQRGGPPPLYGGDAHLTWPLPNAGTMSCRVSFKNTPDEQWLTIEC
jgi:hypothetical protein